MMLAVLLLASVTVLPSDNPAAPPEKKTPLPASMRQMVIPSHGNMLLGVFYLAAGANLHPTAVLLHGFPGYEQNLDIAQLLRTNGWNVLAMHYRGSWGVKGDFSFEDAAEDADAEGQFILGPANAEKYRIDAHRIPSSGTAWAGSQPLPRRHTVRKFRLVLSFPRGT